MGAAPAGPVAGGLGCFGVLKSSTLGCPLGGCRSCRDCHRRQAKRAAGCSGGQSAMQRAVLGKWSELHPTPGTGC